MSPLKDRVVMYCTKKNISISSFERKAGLSNGYFNQVKKRPSEEKIERIKRAFPDLDCDWLLTGTGDMLLPTTVRDLTSGVFVGKNMVKSDVNINSDAFDTLLQMVKCFQEQTAKYQEQMDRLLTLFEKEKNGD